LFTQVPFPVLNGLRTALYYFPSQVYQLHAFGYLAGVVFAFLVGPLADAYGRKLACQLYCVIYIIICVLTHFSSYKPLLVAGVMAGVGTCLLYTAFESW
jgi:MFS transporter, MFS domain-containing protein family, molybdate-anion transporter